MVEEDNKTVEIKIIWKDNTIDYISADSIGAYTEIPGMMVAFKEDSEVPVGFFNTDSIKSISIIEKLIND